MKGGFPAWKAAHPSNPDAQQAVHLADVPDCADPPSPHLKLQQYSASFPRVGTHGPHTAAPAPGCRR